jgi:predicted nucleic acid-binding protein
VIEEAIDARLELVLARPVMVELERILSGKLGFERERWRGVEELLLGLAGEQVAAPEGPPEAVSGDPDDDLILACATWAQVDVLVSGDRRHLLRVGEHRGVRIITPQAVLAELRAG